MRILICTFTFYPDINGVAVVTTAHASYLASMGHEVTVVTGDSNIDSATEIQPALDTVRVVRYKVSGTAHMSHKFRGDVQDYLDFILNWRGDVAFFHCWCSWSTDLALPHFKDLKFKSVIVSHGFNAHEYPQNMRFPRGLGHWLGWKPYIWKMRGHLSSASQLVVLSHSTDPRWYYDHYLARKIGINHISVIPSGVYLEEFDLDRNFRRSELGITTSRMILVVGNYFPNHKNQALALRAFAALKPEDCTLMFIGSKRNEYSQNLEADAEKLGVSHCVRFCAGLPRDLVCAAYRNADIVVCSSIWESGPIVLLEAMAAGVPFVSTDVGYARFLKGGFVVGSQPEMSDRIERLLENPRLIEDLGDKGRKQCESEYSWSAVMQSYDMLIRRLTSQ